MNEIVKQVLISSVLSSRDESHERDMSKPSGEGMEIQKRIAEAIRICT